MDYKKMFSAKCEEAIKHNEQLAIQSTKELEGRYHTIKQLLYDEWVKYVDHCVQENKPVMPVLFIPTSTPLSVYYSLPRQIEVFTLDGLEEYAGVNRLKVIVDMYAYNTENKEN
jgi:hypothetical protein